MLRLNILWRLRFLIAAAALLTSLAARAETGAGVATLSTPYSFVELNDRLDKAIEKNQMGLVTAASASGGARAQGITIPGNRVVGVFRNDFARRMLAASIPAGIEAPIRFYVTENKDGSATLSYKKPTAVFAPYLADALPDLAHVAEELDVIFNAIAKDVAAR